MFKLFTRVNNFHLKNKRRAQQFPNNSCRSSGTLFSRFYQHDVIWKRVDTCRLPSAKTACSLKPVGKTRKAQCCTHSLVVKLKGMKGKEMESQFITTEKNRIWENNRMDFKGPTQRITLQEMLLSPSNPSV